MHTCACEVRHVQLRVHLLRHWGLGHDKANTGHGVQDGCGGHRQRVVFEDVAPGAIRLWYVAPGGELVGVYGKVGEVTVQRVGGEAQFVHDVWRAEQTVCVCQATADVSSGT